MVQHQGARLPLFHVELCTALTATWTMRCWRALTIGEVQAAGLRHRVGQMHLPDDLRAGGHGDPGSLTLSEHEARGLTGRVAIIAFFWRRFGPVRYTRGWAEMLLGPSIHPRRGAWQSRLYDGEVVAESIWLARGAITGRHLMPVIEHTLARPGPSAVRS